MTSAATAYAWEENRLDEILDGELANAVLALCSKLSAQPAIRLLQEALNAVAGWHGDWLPVTGTVGDYTVQLSNELPTREILAKLRRLDKAQ